MGFEATCNAFWQLFKHGFVFKMVKKQTNKQKI